MPKQSTLKGDPKELKVQALLDANTSLDKISARLNIPRGVVERYARAYKKKKTIVPLVVPEMAEPPVDASPKDQAFWHCERIKARMIAAEKAGRNEKEVAGLYGQYTNALRHHARLSGALEVTMAQIIKAPDFQRALSALQRVIGNNRDIWVRWEKELAILMGEG